jgi:hypothetical protein
MFSSWDIRCRMNSILWPFLVTQIGFWISDMSKREQSFDLNFLRHYNDHEICVRSKFPNLDLYFWVWVLLWLFKLRLVGICNLTDNTNTFIVRSKKPFIVSHVPRPQKLREGVGHIDSVHIHFWHRAAFLLKENKIFESRRESFVPRVPPQLSAIMYPQCTIERRHSVSEWSKWSTSYHTQFTFLFFFSSLFSSPISIYVINPSIYFFVCIVHIYINDDLRSRFISPSRYFFYDNKKHLFPIHLVWPYN